MSDLRERLLREGYAWYMRDDGITPDTPLTDALLALYEATEYSEVPGESNAERAIRLLRQMYAARDRITELMGEDT